MVKFSSTEREDLVEYSRWAGRTMVIEATQKSKNRWWIKRNDFEQKEKKKIETQRKTTG